MRTAPVTAAKSRLPFGRLQQNLRAFASDHRLGRHSSATPRIPALQHAEALLREAEALFAPERQLNLLERLDRWAHRNMLQFSSEPPMLQVHQGFGDDDAVTLTRHEEGYALRYTMATAFAAPERWFATIGVTWEHTLFVMNDRAEPESAFQVAVAAKRAQDIIEFSQRYALLCPDPATWDTGEDRAELQVTPQGHRLQRSVPHRHGDPAILASADPTIAGVLQLQTDMAQQLERVRNQALAAGI